jgi:hypothetical protein
MFAYKWGSIQFTKLLWCKGVDLWWWLTCEYLSSCCMCFAGMISIAKMMLYSLFTLDWYALLVWFTSTCLC